MPFRQSHGLLPDTIDVRKAMAISLMTLKAVTLSGDAMTSRELVHSLRVHCHDLPSRLHAQIGWAECARADSALAYVPVPMHLRRGRTGTHSFYDCLRLDRAR